VSGDLRIKRLEYLSFSFATTKRKRNKKKSHRCLRICLGRRAFPSSLKLGNEFVVFTHPFNPLFLEGNLTEKEGNFFNFADI
jgi:hypothetical protein